MGVGCLQIQGMQEMCKSFSFEHANAEKHAHEKE